MPTPSQDQLLLQLRRLRSSGFDILLTQFGTANNLDTAFLYAIASRETNCANILGDKQADGLHGVGIIQIDIQHPIALAARDSGTWQTNPGPLISFGATLLAGNIIQVKHVLPNLTASNDILRVAAAGYNCGVGRAIQGASQGNPDKFTTGGDYGTDVIARMAIFQNLLAALPVANPETQPR
jgi:hypothetical protein